eukprot:3416398-Rhodomonas_salina.1
MGFVIREAAAGDFSGFSVSGGSDVDGDGLADMIIGAPHHDGSVLSPTPNAGSAFVIYGKADRTRIGPVIRLDVVLPHMGVWFTGSNVDDEGGRAVAGAATTAGGEFNADGHDDLLVGLPRASSCGKGKAGLVFVLWGREGTFHPSISDEFYDYYYDEDHTVIFLPCVVCTAVSAHVPVYCVACFVSVLCGAGCEVCLSCKGTQLARCGVFAAAGSSRPGALRREELPELLLRGLA